MSLFSLLSLFNKYAEDSVNEPPIPVIFWNVSEGIILIESVISSEEKSDILYDLNRAEKTLKNIKLKTIGYFHNKKAFQKKLETTYPSS